MASPICNEDRQTSLSSMDVHSHIPVPLSRMGQERTDDHDDVTVDAFMATLSSNGFERVSLACDEDELEPADRECQARWLIMTTPADRPTAFFDALNARDMIRNELLRLQDIRYAPETADAMQFAEGHRPRAVSWLVAVVTALELSKETLHSAVSLFDRFIVGTEAHPPEAVLQLLALGCVSAAAKHEEVSQRSADELVRLAVDNNNRTLYERLDLNRMEWLLLETVEWRIRVPNTHTFLRQYLDVLVNCGSVRRDAAYVATLKACADLLAEVAMLYAEFLAFSYSTVAIACLTYAYRHCQAVFGSASPSAEAPLTPVKRLVSDLASFIGQDAASVAPELSNCLNIMGSLYEFVVVGRADQSGGPPSDDELGLLAPVVARYRKTSSAAGGQ